MLENLAGSPAKNGVHVDGRIAVDWLRFSIPAGSFHLLAGALSIPVDASAWVSSPRYKKRFHCLICDSVVVASDWLPAPDGRMYAVTQAGGSAASAWSECVEPRFIVDFSGEGLARWFMEYGRGLTLLEFLSRLLAVDGVRVNRLDLAFDDYDGLLGVEKVLDYLERGFCVTNWRVADYHRSIEIGGGYLGATCYLGSRVSDNFARVYDKRALELKRGAVEAALPAHWVRLELEVKHDRADLTCRHLVDAGFTSAACLGVLVSLVEFKSPTGDSNDRRWPAVRWWARFTEKVAAFPVRLARPAASIERKEKWVIKAVAPSLALLSEYFGSDEWLDSVLEQGRGRLSRQDLALIADGHGV
jgi:hypothetical protein